MSYKDLFKHVKSDLTQYNFICEIFNKAIKKKTFKMMVNSIRNALRDQITEQLDLNLENIDKHTITDFDSKINGIGANINIILKNISKYIDI